MATCAKFATLVLFLCTRRQTALYVRQVHILLSPARLRACRVLLVLTLLLMDPKFASTAFRVHMRQMRGLLSVRCVPYQPTPPQALLHRVMRAVLAF